MWTRRYLIPYFGKCKLSDISVDMINSFWQVLKEKHGLSPKTINNIRSVFITMMKEAVSKGLIERNPVEMTFARTVDRKKQELLTDEECAKLFDIDRIKELWNDRIVYYVYSLVAGLTGLRAGELLALTINEVQRNKIIVKRSYNESYGMSTTKTSEERVVPITDEIYRYLYVVWQSHPNDENDFIFSFDGKKPMNEGRPELHFTRRWRKSESARKKEKDVALLSIPGDTSSQQIASNRTCIQRRSWLLLGTNLQRCFFATQSHMPCNDISSQRLFCPPELAWGA